MYRKKVTIQTNKIVNLKEIISANRHNEIQAAGHRYRQDQPENNIPFLRRRQERRHQHNPGQDHQI